MSPSHTLLLLGRIFNELIQRIAILIFSLVLTGTASAQLRVSGLVQHEGHPLSDVTINIKMNGNTVQFANANRKGKYSVNLDLDKKYTIEFTRPYMFPVSIEVNTKVIGKRNSELEYDVPLNMVMFYRYDGMNGDITKESIGIISMTGSGEESFSFVPNAQVIEKLKPLQKESLKREANNAQPVISIDKKTKEISAEPDEKNTETKLTIAPDISDSKAEEEELSGRMNKTDAQQKRYAAIEEAKQIELNAAKQVEHRKSGVQTKSAVEEQHYLEESKRLRAEYAELDQAREQSLIAARVKKQEALLVPPINQIVYANSVKTLEALLISHAVDEGVFLFEETFLVQQGSLRHEYKKTVYNWPF